MRPFFALLLLLTTLLTAEETLDLTVDLRDPVFTQGVLSTEKGGVIEGEGIRIQAMHISFTDRLENGVRVKRVVAEGDLLLVYNGQAFVGKELQFDFINRTGTLSEGRTYVDLWFLGGEQIELKGDGSYYIYGAFVTTCEEKEIAWDISAGLVKITREKLLSANNIRFRFTKIPLFWLPSFKSNLSFFKDPPIRYKLTWDKGLGPRVSMRYRVYSWERMHVFLRFDYRFSLGPGAALEGEYHSDDNRTILLSRNYAAYDKVVPDERSPKRWRFQGFYHTISHDEKTRIHLTYDKMSDIKMPSDFKSDDFVINTRKRTLFFIDHHSENFFTWLNFQPRINTFQSLNQELPLVTLGMRPFEIASSGILTANYMNAGFLNYVYATDLHKQIHNTQSVRIETRNALYRPFRLPYCTFTPNFGIIGIFYNNNPRHNAVGQGVLNYGAALSTRLARHYKGFKHVIEPYLRYQGYSQPLVGINDHLIFSIEDGYARLNLLRTGIRNTFFTGGFLPLLTTELFTYGLLDSNTVLSQVFPRTYFDFGLRLPYLYLSGLAVWNQAKGAWDEANVRTECTVNADLAFTLELRHRSRYAWRKADHENFFLDAARSLEELLDSPISDQRNTLLSTIQMRLMPTLTLNFEGHFGWGRTTQPGYSALRVQAIKLIACNWQVKLGYRHIPNDPYQFTASVSLAK